MAVAHIKDALRASLPREVTVLQIDAYKLAYSERQSWTIKFIAPGMKEFASIRIQRDMGEKFPYDEIANKIKVFL